MKQEDFDNQRVWSNVKETLSTLKKITDPSEDESERITEIRYIASQVQGFRKVDPGPFHPEMFSPVNTLWDQVLSSAKNLVNARNAGHLTQATQNAQQTLIHIAKWPKQINRNAAAASATSAFKAYTDSLEGAIEELQQSLAQTLESSETQRKLWEQEVTDLKREAATSQKELASALSGLEQEREQLRALLTRNTTAFNDSQTKRSADFDAAQETRSEKFSKWLGDQEAHFADLVKPHVHGIEVMLQKAQDDSAAVDELRHSTETLAGMTSSEILSKKYGAFAKQERRWGLIAYLFGFIALGLGAWFIWDAVGSVNPSEGVSWSFTVLKIGISTLIVGGATMAFRLGSRFLHSSNASKRIELELHSIGPFLADVSQADAIDAAKLAFVEKTFGRTWESSENRADPDKTTDQLSTIVDLVNAITKRE
jgi:hypothetical protein